LRALIDERLKLQAGKAERIKVSDEDVKKRILYLAQKSNGTIEQFTQFLEQSGIPIETLEQQIRAELTWVRVIQRRFHDQVQISDQDVANEISRIQASGGNVQYRLSQIFLPIDNSGDEQNVAQAARGLVQQLQAGAEFSSLASQFSQDAGALKGGDFGWVHLDELDPEEAKVVQQTPVGQIGGPVRGANGYYIIRVRETRMVDFSATTGGTAAIRQIFWGLASNAAEKEINRATSQARTVAGAVHSCDDFAKAGEKAAPGVYRDLGNVQISDLDPPVQQAILSLQIDQPSDAVRTSKGVGLYIVCDRGGGDARQVSRLDIADRLQQQRIETLARGYLSDLRRSAYVDIRQ
jgi:peptidyl-prolyl cis-trans isomerase SurA